MRLDLRAAALIGVVTIAFVACGDSNDDAVEQRISRERAEAAKQAQQEAEIDRLKDEIKEVKKRGGNTTTVLREVDGRSDAGARPSPVTSSRTASKVFHTPGGRVTCAIYREGADCSVSSIGATFVLPPDGPARIESGVRLRAGSGSSAGWDQTVTAGSITCVIPPQSAPRGVQCSDSATGHGFEASKVPSRQRMY